MLNYDGQHPAERFILGDRERIVSFNLYLYKRPEETLPKKEKLHVCDLYFGFATNLPISSAALLPSFIP
jgi:hypothetical protein